MTTAQLRASLALWQRRERKRKELHTRAQADLDQARRDRVHPRQHLVDRRDLRSRQLKEARDTIARREAQLDARAAPRIITAAQIGLTFQWVFGSLGTPWRLTGHYTAGPRASTAAEGIAIAREVHRQHASQGWGGCSYGPIICDDGTLLLINPINRKSAHVAGNNSGNVPANCPGTTGNQPTAAQIRTYKWWLANAHTRRVPKAYRSPVDLRKLKRYGHNDLNATACPGAYKTMFKEA